MISVDEALEIVLREAAVGEPESVQIQGWFMQLDSFELQQRFG